MGSDLLFPDLFTSGSYLFTLQSYAHQSLNANMMRHFADDYDSLNLVHVLKKRVIIPV